MSVLLRAIVASPSHRAWAPTFVRGLASATPGVVEISSDDQFNKLISGLADRKQVAVVDFTAKWCGPCKFIAPHYEELSKKHPEIKFLKVDIDTPALRETVHAHNIAGVPTFTVYKGSERVETFTGAKLDYLKDVISKHKQ